MFFHYGKFYINNVIYLFIYFLSSVIWFITTKREEIWLFMGKVENTPFVRSILNIKGRSYVRLLKFTTWYHFVGWHAAENAITMTYPRLNVYMHETLNLIFNSRSLMNNLSPKDFWEEQEFWDWVMWLLMSKARGLSKLCIDYCEN